MKGETVCIIVKVRFGVGLDDWLVILTVRMLQVETSVFDYLKIKPIKLISLLALAVSGVTRTHCEIILGRGYEPQGAVTLSQYHCQSVPPPTEHNLSTS